MTRVLAADVGGTKTHLALYEAAPGQAFTLKRQARVVSDPDSALEPIVAEFLGNDRVDAAGFGVAGPVGDGICLTTNLPWVVSLDALRAICKTERCVLRNDAEMAALGIAAVPDDKKVWLQRATVRPSDPITLVTLGTGFGRALLLAPDRAFASEGGHASFAPSDAMGIRLLEKLQQKHDQVAIEHVLSGPGIAALFDTLLTHDVEQAGAFTREDLERTDDPSARIAELGLNDSDPLCAATLAWFAELLGAELGNVALEVLPRGGLYLWGGVARKLRRVIEGPDMLEAFLDKDRMRSVLESVPLALIDSDDLALLGAREAALRA